VLLLLLLLFLCENSACCWWCIFFTYVDWINYMCCLQVVRSLLAVDVRLTCCCCRFVDALGEPQRPCSQCSEIFDSDSELAEHIAYHELHNEEMLKYICPMCQQEFTDEVPQAEFVAHVNTHFDCWLSDWLFRCYVCANENKMTLLHMLVLKLLSMDTSFWLVYDQCMTELFLFSLRVTDLEWICCVNSS